MKDGQMISKSVIVHSLICGVVLASISCKTSSAMVVVDEMDYEEAAPNTYYRDVLFNDEADTNDQINGYDEWVRISKRQTNREATEGRISQRIPLTYEEVQKILMLLTKPKKSDSPKLKGWSASAMPFNVLYTPNSLQQRILSSVNIAESRNESPKAQEPQDRDNYSNKRRNERKPILRPRPSKPGQMRKHYLVIPQLFVSYGWGPHGK